MKQKLIRLAGLGVIITVILSLALKPQTINYYEKEIIPTAYAAILHSVEPLDAYIEALADYECHGCKEGYSRIDINGLRSYGCLQFQENTFNYRAKLYAVAASARGIESCEDQKAIARAWFAADPKGASFAWYTSIYVRGLGFPPQN